jgi:ABC-2 type transport system permease protein
VRATLSVLWAAFRAETQQLRRSRLLVALTVIQAVTFLLMVSVFGLTGSHAPTAVVDNDGGQLAKLWAQDMAAAHHTFGLRYMSQSQAQQALRKGDIVAVVTIPRGFSAAIANHQMIRVPIAVDNINADLTDDVERGIPTAAVLLAGQRNLPGVRAQPVETDLISHDTDYIPYLVVSALALDAFVVAGILAASAVAREFEARTITGLRLAPVSALVPLAGRVLASSAVSAVAMALTALVVVLGYGVVPLHALQMAGALLLCVVIFSCIGAGIGALLRRTLPVAALLFGLALPLYIDSGSLEPQRFDGDVIWYIAHTSPVYYAVGVLQHAVHGLQVTPESIGLDVVALLGWAVLAGGVAWTALRRGVQA